MKYDILSATDKELLTELTNKNLLLGWILKGGVTVDNGKFFQAISHPSDGDHKPYTGESSEEEEIDGYNACVVCGEMDCDKPLHAEIGALSKIITELKKNK